MVKNTNETDKLIGEKIVSARMIRGLNRKALAEKLGVTHQQLQKYEKGFNRISASRLSDISNILGIAVNYFFTETAQDKVLREEGEKFDINSINEIVGLASRIKNKSKLEAIKNLIKSMET